MNNFKLFIILFFSVIFLASCGGEGSADNFDVDPQPLVNQPDTTEPETNDPDAETPDDNDDPVDQTEPVERVVVEIQENGNVVYQDDVTFSNKPQGDIDLFDPAIATDIINNRCISCHSSGNTAQRTPLVFGDSNFYQSVFDSYALHNGVKLLDKVSKSVPHNGGEVVASDTQEYANLEQYIATIELVQTWTAKAIDTDGDGVYDALDPDDDGDGIKDVDDTFPKRDVVIEPEEPEQPIDSSLAKLINDQVILAKCIACHTTSGQANNSGLVFVDSNQVDNQVTNIDVLTTYLSDSSKAETLLQKVQGLLNHTGGKLFSPGSVEYGYLEELIALLELDDELGSYPQNFNKELKSQTYRRASVILTGNVPTKAELQRQNTLSDAEFELEIINLMQGEGFKQFIKNGANDQLLVRAINVNPFQKVHQVWRFWYPEYGTMHVASVNAGNSVSTFRNAVANELAEAPLELINYVVQNNKPYSEILTADYTMVSELTAQIFKTNLSPNYGEYVRTANNLGQQIKNDNNKKPVVWDKGAIESGSLKDSDDIYTATGTYVSLPNAGVLSNYSYLNKYFTTATNRNRMRSRWTNKFFLGFDIEKSSPRLVDGDLQFDYPTLENPNCIVCHVVMDPIAGTFQNFGEDGIYRDGYNGEHTLDEGYRKNKEGLYTFQSGDLWYRDMLPAGFGDEPVDTPDTSLAFLAKKIIADDRFAAASVQFWWPAIFGEDLLENDLDSRILAQQQFIKSVAANFAQHQNLKRMLAQLILSDWFRASASKQAVEEQDLVIYRGGKRLLTPEEISAKSKSLTGFELEYNTTYQAFYGGIDSEQVTKRVRRMSSPLFNVAKLQANKYSCLIAGKDFEKSKNNRKLFTVVNLSDTSESLIKAQLVTLYERLLGETYGNDSAEINAAYQLFIDAQNSVIASNEKNILKSYERCESFNGNTLTNKTNGDPEQTFSAWKVVLTALLSDYSYLYE
ncbi:hypothetical protein [Thalassomonas sp. M1454]|uniref:hypothetical protein n=1 Tax=Thalassomonas sp. M1454 TaxID=2594477 RepID=UPI00117CD7F2|nr:hypothetical protein [Thalassomonas sp. M1454]TRX55806.1 hypothetical protein FNN08_09295 [Thalassomonas sp. M1454]